MPPVAAPNVGGGTHRAIHYQTAAVSESQQPDAPLGPTEVEPLTPVLDELPGAVLLLDAGGLVLYMNHAAEELLTRPREHALGRDLFRELLPDLGRQGRDAEYRSTLEAHPASVQWTVTISGPRGDRPFAVTVRSYDGSFGRRGILVIDDRSAFAVEIERRRKAERLAAVGELAAGAAHEINNPLASIKGFAQLLSRETLDRGQHQALEIISQECSRVARIVDNLLEFATQQSVVGRELVNLSTIAETVLTLKRYALETSGIEIEVDLDQSLCSIEAESGAIQRLILILVNHAERSLLRMEGTRSLLVRSRESNDGVVLYLSDNGPGIPRHHLPSLFESDTATDAGLGLNTADLIARDHGGGLWIESGEGKGTTFTLRLPRSARPEPIAPAASVTPPAETDEPRAVRILVADDEATLRLALAMFLGRHGYEVDQAENVEQALKMLEQHEYDVALVDVRMPGDGLTLLSILDDSPDWTGQAILMTGDHTQARIRDEIRAGRPHLTKPFDMTDAVRLIESVRGDSSPANHPRPSTWTSS